MSWVDYTIWGGLVFGMIGLVIYFINYKSYNWTVYVKEVVHNGHKKFYIDSGKIYYDKHEKAKFLRLWKTRDPLLHNSKAILPLPPDKCIYIGRDGRNVVELYKTTEGVFAYAQDSETGEVLRDEAGNPIQENLKIYNKYRFVHDTRTIVATEPFTTNQRIIYARRLEHAASRTKKGILDVINTVAVPMVLGIIVISLLAFYGDMGKPLLEMADKVNQNEYYQTQQIQMLVDISNGVQRITGEPLNSTNTIQPPAPYTPPQKAGIGEKLVNAIK